MNLKTQEIGLLICLWENKFADKTVDFATCVDKTGKRYNIELDNIRDIQKKVKEEGPKRPKLVDEDLTFTYEEIKYTKYLISFK